MSDFELDPDAVATQAAHLRDEQAGLAGMAQVPRPDTGETTALTDAVLAQLEQATAELAAALGELAEDVDQCLALYDEADGAAQWGLALMMKLALS